MHLFKGKVSNFACSSNVFLVKYSSDLITIDTNVFSILYLIILRPTCKIWHFPFNEDKKKTSRILGEAKIMAFLNDVDALKLAKIKEKSETVELTGKSAAPRQAKPAAKVPSSVKSVNVCDGRMISRAGHLRLRLFLWLFLFKHSFWPDKGYSYRLFGLETGQFSTINKQKVPLNKFYFIC